MSELVVPVEFAHRTIQREGAAGRAWLAALPGLVARLLSEWGLVIRSGPRAGTVALVWEVVRSDGSAAVLKVGWEDAWSRDEAAALRLWDGAGAVRLLASDDTCGSMLLEQLAAHRSLGEEPMGAALRAAAQVATQLHVSDCSAFATVLDQVGNTPQLSAQYEHQVAGLWPAIESAVAGAPTVLLHGDLHYDNVLWSGTGWKAIDPKPVAGPAEWEYIPLLRNRFAEYDPSDLHRSIRRRLDCLLDLTAGRRQEAYLFAHFRALLDADFAHRVQDANYEHVSMTIATATKPRLA